MRAKFLLKVILVCFLFLGVLLFFNLVNFRQLSSDKISYNTSINRIGTKEYTTEIKFNYSVTYGQEKPFLIYVNKDSLVLNCQHIKCTNKVTIKIKDRRGRIIYKKDIGDEKDEKLEISNLKNGEYEVILAFHKGVGEGYIKIE
ncbi:DUF3244 domain-containing protein [Caldicellulosiruptor bescii]|uniref:Uncharacterized protein n=2 Tax=Caldicellulosiruptor bescii TaxID=31899 RepID=B9MQQ7_CALBD|nr:hypothetical protein [Caldicellulosiruptor bescii]ACM60011.1 hypothetical protein Athe_0904 [Caldicellulosiruptor bescii DSM 6725]PBC87430.1 hypothetical protein B0S87_0333 [Caldicellulosiruptor bescii]PBD04204.1 hypothetical protein B0S85_1843 [Caldicellulosiruptor bescii]PBD08833.1 hypothetical protein B0S84_1197 [Caldicellulosiruptor bescii]PFH15320.1 hypothetical protein B0S88_1787 [Caldicellulosiruptor bescii]